MRTPARSPHKKSKAALVGQGLVTIAELTLTRAPVDEVIRQVLELLQRAVPYEVGAFYWWDLGRQALRRAAVVATEASSAPLEIAGTDRGNLMAEAVVSRTPLVLNREG